KTRGQRAPHPNTSIPHDRQKPNQFARYGYFQSHTRKQSWHPVGWISLSASTASASLSRWWMRKLIHPTKAPIVGWGKTRGQRAPHPNTSIPDPTTENLTNISCRSISRARAKRPTPTIAHG